jgi:hypothetical protein
MVKITWLGEDTEETPGPSFNIWNGIKFPKGQPVEVTDAHMIKKATAGTRFWRVEEEAKHEKEKEEKPSAQQADPQGEPAHRRQEKQLEEQQQTTGYSPAKKKSVRKKAPAPARADADPRPSDDAT